MDNHHIDSAAAFGTLVRGRRRELGMSQDDLASLTGIPQPNLSRIETGRNVANFDTCLKLCSTLGIDLIGISRQ